MSLTTNADSRAEHLREGTDGAFNQVMLAFLNAATGLDIIPIWRVIHYLEDYFQSELNLKLPINEGVITNSFRALREQGLVYGYFRPSPLHKKTGSSLAIILEEIPASGLIGTESKEFIYFSSVVNANDELTMTPLKKTASNLELLKALLSDLLNEDISDSLREKVQDLKNELASHSV